MTVVYYACYASSSLGADALVLKPAAAIQGLQNARSWNYLPTSRMRATYDAEVQHGFRARCNVVSLCNHDRLDHDVLIGLAMVCPELPVDFNLALCLGDTGAFCHAVPDLKFAVPGSVCANTLAVDTANGPSVPKSQCDVAMEVLLEDGTIRVIILRNALVLDGKLRHTLVSLGTLAREGVAGTYHIHGDNDTTFGRATRVRRNTCKEKWARLCTKSSCAASQRATNMTRVATAPWKCSGASSPTTRVLHCT